MMMMMMKRLVRNAVWLGLGLGLSGAAQTPALGIRFTDAGGLFTSPSCNTTLAVSRFKERVARVKPGISSDDHLPWPDMYGYWLDASRDLVIGIEYTDSANAPLGTVTVRFYSLCNGISIAKGTRVLTTSDLKQGEMKVTMYMGKAFPDRLEVLLTPGDVKQTDRVQVRVLNTSTMNQEHQVLDQFKVRRL